MVCSVDECGRKAASRGMCGRHYQRWRTYGDPMFTKLRRGTAAERFAGSYKVAPSGCWLWAEWKTPDGYGRFRDDSARKVLAHVWAWQRKNGPVPEGKQLDHFACSNAGCVNPDHVRPVTPWENTLRSDSPCAWNRAKTHCIHGHPFDESNTIRTRAGRKCRECKRIQMRRSRALRKVTT